jgi:methyl-accepting chemotaxis protein
VDFALNDPIFDLGSNAGTAALPAVWNGENSTMQAKMGAGFLIVALLYVLVGLGVPRLGLGRLAEAALVASAYVVIGLSAAWILSFVLSRRLRQLARAASLISKGDLTIEVETRGADETAELARSLSLMTQSLRDVVQEVEHTADRVSSSAQALSSASCDINEATEEIAGAAREIARGAEEQAAQVMRTTETTRGLTRGVERVADQAREFYEAAATSADSAARGASDVRHAADAITQLTARTGSATAAVEGFRLKATEIDSIVSSITSISHQTHLLAINAAIEAARAGEEGRGFGVVAEEVSRLADNVRQFAEQISSISDEIMQGSHAVADEIRKSVSAANELREVIDRSARSFDGVVTATRGTAASVGEISEFTVRQKLAAEELARLLEGISRIAERNARGTEEASAATAEQTVSMQRMTASARTLARTSDQLKELIAIFKLR